MNNYKTSILSIVTGSILFSSSFAIGANSHRLESLADRTSNFVYPKVDEIAPIQPQIASIEPTQPEIRRTTSKPNSTVAMTTAVPKQYRVTPISKKVRVRKTQPNVAIPISPANELPLEDDNNDISIPVASTEEVAPLSREVTQPDRKQQVQKPEAPNELREEIKQVKREEKKEDKIATKSSPPKSEKEVESEPITPSEPLE